MDPLTFEAITRNPELLDALMEQARRERAETMHRLLVEPLKGLFGRQRRYQPNAATTAACTTC
jgi:hypothetical protein